VSWVAVFDVFLVCHLVGDFLLQTDWQAMHKYGGLGGDTTARRALTSHVATYTLAFVPALVWIACQTELWRALPAAVLIAAEHLIQDDGRLLGSYMRRVKGPGSVASPGIRIAVDQSFHALFLFGVALLVVS
jgi:hypothetical protein